MQPSDLHYLIVEGFGLKKKKYIGILPLLPCGYARPKMSLLPPSRPNEKCVELGL